MALSINARKMVALRGRRFKMTDVIWLLPGDFILGTFLTVWRTSMGQKVFESREVSHKLFFGCGFRFLGIGV